MITSIFNNNIIFWNDLKFARLDYDPEERMSLYECRGENDFYEFFHEADLFDDLQEQLNNPEPKNKPDYKPQFDAMFDDTLERLEHITNPFNK